MFFWASIFRIIKKKKEFSMMTYGVQLTQLLSDPVSSSTSLGRQVHGLLVLHVDDGLWTGDPIFTSKVIDPLFKEYQVGAVATNDLAFLGQHIVKHKDHITIDQNTGIGEMEEV
jgi:hypothetical protein